MIRTIDSLSEENVINELWCMIECWNKLNNIFHRRNTLVIPSDFKSNNRKYCSLVKYICISSVQYSVGITGTIIVQDTSRTRVIHTEIWIRINWNCIQYACLLNCWPPKLGCYLTEQSKWSCFLPLHFIVPNRTPHFRYIFESLKSKKFFSNHKIKKNKTPTFKNNY